MAQMWRARPRPTEEQARPGPRPPHPCIVNAGGISMAISCRRWYAEADVEENRRIAMNRWMGTLALIPAVIWTSGKFSAADEPGGRPVPAVPSKTMAKPWHHW